MYQQQTMINGSKKPKDEKRISYVGIMDNQRIINNSIKFLQSRNKHFYNSYYLLLIGVCAADIVYWV